MEKHSLSPALSSALITITAIALSSCRTQYIPMPAVHQRDSLVSVVHKKVNNTYIDRTHTLVQRGDTIFKTDSIYVEKFTDVEVHDTVVVIRTDTITIRENVPCPSRRKPLSPFHRGDAPRFYKNCTIGFFLLLLALLAYIAIRFYLHR